MLHSAWHATAAAAAVGDCMWNAQCIGTRQATAAAGAAAMQCCVANAFWVLISCGLGVCVATAAAADAVCHANRSLGAAGVKSLLAVPISFVSEHIETLEEIDMEYR